MRSAGSGAHLHSAVAQAQAPAPAAGALSPVLTFSMACLLPLLFALVPAAKTQMQVEVQVHVARRSALSPPRTLQAHWSTRELCHAVISASAMRLSCPTLHHTITGRNNGVIEVDGLRDMCFASGCFIIILSVPGMLQPSLLRRRACRIARRQPAPTPGSFK